VFDETGKRRKTEMTSKTARIVSMEGFGLGFLHRSGAEGSVNMRLTWLPH